MQKVSFGNSLMIFGFFMTYLSVTMPLGAVVFYGSVFLTVTGFLFAIIAYRESKEGNDH